MKRKGFMPLALAAVAAAGAVAVAGADSSGPSLTNVPSANEKATGYAPSNVLSRELREHVVAEGSDAVEDASGIVTNYGYENDVPSPDDPAVPQLAPVGNPAAEAQKTEPDKNTYLVLDGQKGADPNYDYGTHFLFQGHEGGAPVGDLSQGYITRINLDADSAHRVTVMASKDTAGNPIATIDGSTWDPFAQRLLFTTEDGAAPEYAATLDYPSSVEDISGSIGRGGYEGIQVDSAGNVWIVEDSGGSFKDGSVVAKKPNSFVYRFVPAAPGDLEHGRLQVLQVWRDGKPITWESESSFPSADQIALHSGATFRTKWVTIHDTSKDGRATFDANALARAAKGTPFKRPENGVFRPGTGFGEFYFTETGDTDATSSEDPGNQGGFGGIFEVSQSGPSANDGSISLFAAGDLAHTGYDNIAFLSQDQLLVVEDGGDTLHTQRKALDSGYVYDVSNPQAGPTRWLAEGRDVAATLDSAAGGYGKNDGDNEITGLHVSDGDPGVAGLLGAKLPAFGKDSAWRWFYTQQHGENRTWEVTAAS